MLTKYAKENGFCNTHFYVDDGITGTRFDRPGFQEMLDDIEMGYVSTVIVKDLSRLGRDYVTVGQYTDIYFPDHNVRFIAINDLVDSDEGENEIAPFKNVMNEFYAQAKSQTTDKDSLQVCGISGTAESCKTAQLPRRNPQGRCRRICSERTIGIIKKSRLIPVHTYKKMQNVGKKKSSALIQLSGWLRTLDMVLVTGLEPF